MKLIRKMIIGLLQYLTALSFAIVCVAMVLFTRTAIIISFAVFIAITLIYLYTAAGIEEEEREDGQNN